jgi:chromosome segregation ATPase
MTDVGELIDRARTMLFPYENGYDQLQEIADALEAAHKRIAALTREVDETQEKLRLANMHCEVLANDCDELRAALQPEHKEGRNE